MKKKSKFRNNNLPKNFNALIIRKDPLNKYNLNVEKTEIKNLGCDEIIIKVSYSSLNYKDVLLCSGNPGLVRKYPHIPGIDAAGTVIHSYSKKFKKGDSVIIVARPMGIKSSGGLAQYIKVPSKWVEKLPVGLTLKKAMIFGTAGFTATLAIHLLLKSGLKKTNYPVLVSGATGGVGILSVLILSKLGFRVCATTGKLEHEVLLKKIGANEIIHRNEFSNYPNMPLLKTRFAGIVDNIGGDIISVGSRQLVARGKIAAIGMLSKENFHMNIMPFILRGIQIIGVNAESTHTALRKQIWKKIVKISKESLLKLVYQECNIYKSINIINKIKNNTNVGRVIVKMT